MLCCVLLRVLWCVVVWCGVVLVWFAAALRRVTVTPVVCPRLFEFLNTLTFGALRKNHIVSTAFEAVQARIREVGE